MKYLSDEIDGLLESAIRLTWKANENQSFNKIIIKFKSILRVYLIAMCIYQEKRDDTRPLA